MKRTIVSILFLFTGILFSQTSYDAFADSLQGNYDTWVNHRVENAKNGIKENIEMPFGC